MDNERREKYAEETREKHGVAKKLIGDVPVKDKKKAVAKKMNIKGDVQDTPAYKKKLKDFISHK